MAQRQLNPRQLAFAREYVKDFNVPAAVLRAGYNTKNPSVIGSRLLRHIGIQQLLGPGKEARRNEALSDIARWRAEVGKIAFADLPPSKLTHDHKLKGLDLYGKHVGAFQSEGTGMQAFQIAIHIGKEE